MLPAKQQNTVTFIKRAANNTPIEETVKTEAVVLKLVRSTHKNEYEQLNTIVDVLLNMSDTGGQQRLSKMIMDESDFQTRTQFMSIMIQKEFQKEGTPFLRGNGIFIKTFMKCEAEPWLKSHIDIRLAPHLRTFISFVDNELKTQNYSKEEFEPSDLSKYKTLLSTILNVIFSVPLDDFIIRNCHYISKHSPIRTELSINRYINGYLILSIINPEIENILKNTEYYKSIDIEHRPSVMTHCRTFGQIIFQKTLQELFNQNRQTHKSSSSGWKKRWEQWLADTVFTTTYATATKFINRSKQTTSTFPDVPCHKKDTTKESDLLHSMKARVLTRVTTEAERLEIAKRDVSDVARAESDQKKLNTYIKYRMQRLEKRNQERKIEKKCQSECIEFIKTIKRNPQESLTMCNSLKKTFPNKEKWAKFLDMDNSAGETALGTALERKNKKLAKRILNVDFIRLFLSFSKGESIPYIMIKTGQTDLFKFIAKKLPLIPPLENDTNKFTPLMGAIEYNRHELIKILLSKSEGFALAHQTDGKSDLHKAIEEYANIETLIALVTHTPSNTLGRLVTTPCKKDNTLPIMAALSRSRFDEATFIMKCIVEGKIAIPRIKKGSEDQFSQIASMATVTCGKIADDNKNIKLDQPSDDKTFLGYYYEQLAPYLQYIDKYVPSENDRSTNDTTSLLNGLLMICEKMLMHLEYYRSKNTTPTQCYQEWHSALTEIKTLISKKPLELTTQEGKQLNPPQNRKRGTTTTTKREIPLFLGAQRLTQPKAPSTQKESTQNTRPRGATAPVSQGGIFSISDSKRPASQLEDTHGQTDDKSKPVGIERIPSRYMR